MANSTRQTDQRPAGPPREARGHLRVVPEVDVTFDLDPADVCAGMLDGLERDFLGIRRALDAELRISEFLGLLEMYSPPDMPAAAREACVLAAVQGFATLAEDSPTPARLAILRTLAVLAPGAAAEAAAEAAKRLAAQGVPDRRWAAAVGRPIEVRAWRYSDLTGHQVVVVLAFEYSHRQHALNVLIDHDLGGGIKDCFCTDKVDTLVAGLRGNAAAAEDTMDMTEISLPEARDLVVAAMARPGCPVEADQVEDTQLYAALLAARMHWLAAPAQERARVAKTRPANGRRLPQVYRLKVAIAGAKPPIWRRLEVPAEATLDTVHGVLQAAFGWYDCHLHAFETDRGHFADPFHELEDTRDEARVRLRDIALAGSTFRYSYDFGDGWEHVIKVEAVTPVEPGVEYPRCLAGRRSGPIEDSGGIWGYQDVLDALADPEHPEHAERVEWLSEFCGGNGFDPTRFDLEEVNDAFKPLRDRGAKRGRTATPGLW